MRQMRYMNFPNLDPSQELSYLLGAVYSDGSAFSYKGNRQSRTYEIWLRVKDEDFAIEFNRCMCRILRKRKKAPYPVSKTKDGFYIAKGYSKLLVEFLNQPIDQHKEIINAYPSFFVRGFADGDGGVAIKDRDPWKEVLVQFTNSSKPFLLYLKQLLSNKFGINSDVEIHSEKEGRKYFRLRIGRHTEILRYYKHIGFTIRRKQQRLEEAVEYILRDREILVGYTTEARKEIRSLLKKVA